MGAGNYGSRIGVIAVALLAAAALCAAALVTDAGAAKLVGKDGKVYACYRTKGKAKGAVRLVTKKAHCKKGQKKVSWNVTGPAGQGGGSGENGETATAAEPGTAGEPGAKGIPGLEQRVQAMTSKVASLESVLKGISNTELLGALSKLQGVSGGQLQEAVASLTKVNALCSQTSKLTSQVDALGESLDGLELLTALPVELKTITPIPVPLSTFSCP
jgi:hypothetical protein